MNVRRKLSEVEQQEQATLQRIWNEKKDVLGLTQVKVANKFGFANAAAVSQYLTGRIALNIRVVAKFANELGVSIEEISPRFSKMLPEFSSSAPTLSVNDIEHIVFEKARNNVMAPIICEGDLLAIDTRYVEDEKSTGITLPTGKVVAIFREKS